MNTEIRLIIDGREVVPRFTHEMWRADVGDKHFCSQTLDGLISGIQGFHSATIVHPHVHHPPETVLTRLVKIMRGVHPLQHKQDALKQLMTMMDEPEARLIVNAISAKQLSRDALRTSVLCEKEFVFITVAEFTEKIKNLVLRAKLIGELAELYRLD